MRVVVTGAAGFIGSHLCELLLSEGDQVLGIDAFTEYYDPLCKEANVARLLNWPDFTLIRADLREAPLETFLENVDVVYHLAGQPGVRPSWGHEFAVYMDRNILATQWLLEALLDCPVGKVIYASSSSVYGDAVAYPMAETLRPQPISPYGVTKLAAEHLCELYRKTSGVPTASLRLFTVYGPGQRPDMAFRKLVAAAVNGERFFLYGDGEQTRDFTYVGDVVQAMRAAALSSWTGVANIGGGSRISMNEVVRTLETLGQRVQVVNVPAQRGDVQHTGADIRVAHQGFGYSPTVPLADGLAAMVEAERLLRVAELP
jgi:nucleoside-diphosphate-sugar epimerase